MCFLWVPVISWHDTAGATRVRHNLHKYVTFLLKFDSKIHFNRCETVTLPNVFPTYIGNIKPFRTRSLSVGRAYWRLAGAIKMDAIN
jgi:hypothetical protein